MKTTVYEPKKLHWYHSITFKNFIVFFLISVIGQGILVYNYVIDSRDYEISQQTNLMKYVALNTRNILDASQITTFRRPALMQTDAYKATQRILAQTQAESGVDNAILIRRNVLGDFYYVADGNADFALGAPVHIHPIYPDTKLAAQEAWETGMPTQSKTFGPPGSHWIQVLTPIFFDGKVDALLMVNENADAVVESRTLKVYSILALSNVILVVGLGIFIFFSRKMLRPLEVLQERSIEVAKGDLHVNIPALSRRDEVGELNNAFIHMVHELEQAQIEATKNWELKLAESEKVMALNETFEKFVPHEFLKCLEKDHVTEIEIGDHTRTNMSILFSDIRAFTSFSEKMTPAENFQFLNDYLEIMGPIIRQEGGFIDKYIGDAIMALFSQKADDALRAAISMQKQLHDYNITQRSQKTPIRIGVGINTGALMLGTIGEHHRMEGTVIGDAVNLASRIEGITKLYGLPILTSQNTVAQLEDKSQFGLRIIDHVQVQGKEEVTTVFEVFDADPPPLHEGKLATLEKFEAAVELYFNQNFEKAAPLFQSIFEQTPQDTIVQRYIQRCQHAQQQGKVSNWTGVTVLERK